MEVLNLSMTTLENDFTYVKGPLLDDFKKVRHECLGLQRELERMQS